MSMHPDLEWLARNVSEWGGNDEYPFIGLWRNPDRAVYSAFDSTREVWRRSHWLQARKDLGLDSKGISEPDEEDCLQLAYERMNYESAKITIEEMRNKMKEDLVNKPKHYQLREGYEVYDLRQDLAAKAANGGATYDQYSDWDRALEYQLRCWQKNRVEDLKKARWYLDKLIEKLERSGE